MTNKNDLRFQASERRRKAEEFALQKPALALKDIHAMSAEDIQQILHELRVHQIELEMQNEELRRAQAEIEAGRDRYYDLYDLAPVGYCTLSEHGLILEANLTAATLLGVPRSQLVTQRLSRFILKEDHDIYYLHRKQLLETATLQKCDLRLVKPDSDSIWVHLKGTFARAEDGAPICRVVLTDITERDQAEVARRESEEKYRRIFENELMAICIFDLETLRFIDVNDTFVQLYGYSHEELIGDMTINDITVEHEASQEATREAKSVGTIHIPLRFHKKKDGTVFPLEIVGGPYSLKGRQVMFAMMRDITERKQAEEMREKLQAQLIQAKKAESLGRMAGAVAHIFNNQLSVVIGNLEMAIEDLSRDAKPVTQLTSAMQGARKAAEVSGLMLTYLGQTLGSHVPLDLSESCRQSLPLLQAGASHGLILKVNLPSPGPTVKANTNQIQQMLTNLVTNAWEAVGEKQGTVTLTVKTVPQTDISEVHRYPTDWQTENAAYACLEVTDTGCGIAGEAIDKIFDPFYSTKFTGRGLGLPVVFGIVKAHDGVITVASKEHGSTFRVFLPLSAEEIPRQPDKSAQPFARDGSGTVLLIEDELMLRDMAKAMIMQLGYTVLSAKDGIEALEMFARHQDEIRCVVSDVTMPRMSGWETLAALRKLSPGIPVIFSSGYDEAQVLIGDHPERPQAFLHKPYQMVELQAALAKAMED